MVRPRWHAIRPFGSNAVARSWDRFVAVWASVNLLWVCFDLTYVPLRTFWLQRNLYPLPSLPVVLPLQLLPDITPFYDPVKGIEPHRETQLYLTAFEQLDRALSAEESAPELRRRQVELTRQMIDETRSWPRWGRERWKRSKIACVSTLTWIRPRILRRLS